MRSTRRGVRLAVRPWRRRPGRAVWLHQQRQRSERRDPRVPVRWARRRRAIRPCGRRAHLAHPPWVVDRSRSRLHHLPCAQHLATASEPSPVETTRPWPSGTKTKETRADDRAELQRLTAERKALPTFVPTTPDAVRAARDAVTAAERIQVAECGKRGPNCRTRESEEQAKRDALATVLTNRATTERAERLDAAMARVRDRLDKGEAVRNVNPQGALAGQALPSA